jgi:serine/threonine-protein kinase RsbW
MVEDPDARKEFVCSDLVRRFDMTLAATVKAIEPAVERIMAVVRDMSCGTGKEFEIETALREALANAIVHGAKEDPNKMVGLSVACDAGRGMVIVVRDPGEGFDPAEIPSPVEGEQVFEDHGRGIYLIRRLMDEVRYRKGGTEIWMRKT